MNHDIDNMSEKELLAGLVRQDQKYSSSGSRMRLTPRSSWSPPTWSASRCVRIRMSISSGDSPRAESCSPMLCPDSTHGRR